MWFTPKAKELKEKFKKNDITVLDNKSHIVQASLKIR